jgi:RNA polymerase sigma factor (sigma-70 family)
VATTTAIRAPQKTRKTSAAPVMKLDSARGLARKTRKTVAAPVVMVDNTARDLLIVKHIPLVKYVLGKVAANLPNWVDRDDLFEAGLVGLIDAAKRFDPDREIAFNTYAVVRIRGSILDEIRANDWLPRSARDKVDRLRGAQRELMKKNELRPSPRELARVLRIPESEVMQLMKMADGHAPV